eukprot:CAMPEP_0183721076 /NCGR_PEP_ID=MMETSP0737-20130205/13494_1 /TAXON_ID=385413 /ORGANISM="Thalassiosira miniscula, Strain CCMP1093" /LENGTH=689 /DNA_ID=CAMNT_0025951045 /DNA_START=18 /DNA_END=2087 /DNA_ORIENTATION=-
MNEVEKDGTSRRKRLQKGDALRNGHSDISSSSSHTNGSTNSDSGRTIRRRAVANNQKSTNAGVTTILILGIGVISCSMVGFMAVMFFMGDGADSRQQSSKSPSSIGVSQVGSTSSNNNPDGKEDDHARILSELVGNKKYEQMSLEELEKEVLTASHDELNTFPITIGRNAYSNEWETIQHPSTEAMEHFSSRGGSQSEKAKKLAEVLSGKKLRGGVDNSDANDNNVSGGGANKDEEGYMRVPKFWDPQPYKLIADERQRRNGGNPPPPPPAGSLSDIIDKGGDGVRRYLGNYGARLMTPVEAKSIGSRIPSQNASKSGEMLETIFVAIASYRDYQCSRTVESAFSRATHPERLRVAVVDQIRLSTDVSCSVPPLGPCSKFPHQVSCKYKSQIDYLTVDAELSVGPVFARHLGHRMYRGEYFAMQSDAHVEFVTGWDDEIIEEWKMAKNEMAILSTYLSGTDDHIDLKTGQRTSLSRPIMCKSDFEGSGGMKHLRHGQQPEGVPYIHEPVFDPFWAAGFSFGRGHFVVNVPYDQHLPWIFQGEEISITLRGFSYGYDFYSPEKSVCYHFYGRKDVPLFWENSGHFRETGTYGMNRLNAIIHMTGHNVNNKAHAYIKTDELKYGLGNVRDTQKFFETFGIHVKSQTVENHLCRFVGRPMQKEFMPFLRKNEMGLDYDRITYRFVDKWPNEP